MAKTLKGHILLLSLLLLNSLYTVAAPDGKALFQSNCAACHNPLKDATGPALKDVDKRVPSKEWLYKWVHNSASLVASGDKYAVDIFNKWNRQP
ncbi:MAG TPA: c-type cytochrome [Chitinophagaceae bacterium]|nr:c-type cytochrome [Chitinophagaceae bacterium]